MSDFRLILLIFTEQCFWPGLSDFYCIVGAKMEFQKWGVTLLVVSASQAEHKSHAEAPGPENWPLEQGVHIVEPRAE